MIQVVLDLCGSYDPEDGTLSKTSHKIYVTFPLKTMAIGGGRITFLTSGKVYQCLL